MISDFWLILGYKCNNRCKHCYAKQKSFSGKWMDIDYAYEVIETLVEIKAKNCLLIGGEPTLYKKLIQLIEFGSDKGLNMILISNGRKLKNFSYTESLYKAGLSRAVISIEGSDDIMHNYITGCNSYNDTLKGIEISSKIGKVSTLTTICEINHRKLIEIAESAYACGAERTVFNFEIPDTDFAFPQSYNDADAFNPIQMAHAAQSAYLQAQKQKMPIYINCTIPACLFDRDVFNDMLKNRAVSLGCHMYTGKGVAFDSEKNILPCTHFANAYLVNGKSEIKKLLLKRDFADYWQNELGSAEKFRSMLWKYPSLKCENCEFWGGCIGGCPLLWGKFDPHKFIEGRR
jgi:radical SAM protein with 4Fe4S-binding SPASM domain